MGLSTRGPGASKKKKNDRDRTGGPGGACNNFLSVLLLNDKTPTKASSERTADYAPEELDKRAGASFE